MDPNDSWGVPVPWAVQEQGRTNPWLKESFRQEEKGKAPGKWGEFFQDYLNRQRLLTHQSADSQPIPFSPQLTAVLERSYLTS